MIPWYATRYDGGISPRQQIDTIVPSRCGDSWAWEKHRRFRVALNTLMKCFFCCFFCRDFRFPCLNVLSFYLNPFLERFPCFSLFFGWFLHYINVWKGCPCFFTQNLFVHTNCGVFCILSGGGNVHIWQKAYNMLVQSTQLEWFWTPRSFCGWSIFECFSWCFLAEL